MTAEKDTSEGATSIHAIVGILADILVNQLNVSIPVEKIDEQASLEDDLGLDSVALIELIGAIEARFGFAFLDSDLRTSSFRNLHVLAEVVASRIRAPASGIAV